MRRGRFPGWHCIIVSVPMLCGGVDCLPRSHRLSMPHTVTSFRPEARTVCKNEGDTHISFAKAGLCEVIHSRITGYTKVTLLLDRRPG